MPIYMDRHDIPGVTARDVALAHQADLKVQHEYGCRGITYWFDEAQGIAFCLVEAPKKEAVQAMHNRAHGLIPHQIVEVDTGLVESFLGRIKDADHVNHSDTYINETAMRVLLATDLKDAALMETRHGIEKTVKLFNKHNSIIRRQISEHKGREVETGGNGMLASFTSIVRAVDCAKKIQQEFKRYNDSVQGEGLHISVALNIGMPVTDRPHFFEEGVQLVQRLCYLAGPEEIMVSSEVFDQVKREDISIFEDRTHIRILSPKDEDFLNELMDSFERYWTDSNFSVKELCRDTGSSKSRLNRKVAFLTGHSPNEFIREYRLNKALDLIEHRKGNISEIAFETGFSSPSYFSRCFLRKYGILPSKMITKNR